LDKGHAVGTLRATATAPASQDRPVAVDLRPADGGRVEGRRERGLDVDRRTLCGAVDNPYEISYAFHITMKTVTASAARERLYRLLDEAAASHEPVQITGRRASAVLITAEDWQSVQETLYLLSIPGMRESIRRGLKTPVDKCRREPGW
jgi:prevent-host-death family protein